jgi:HSP20 family protein
MALIRYPGWFDLNNPRQEFTRMKREMDRLFAGLISREGLGAAESGVFPPLNVREDGENVYVCAEIPGIDPQNLDISVHGSTLTLRGERKLETPENVSFHRRERSSGTFHKSVTLPVEVAAERVSAECRDGLLKLVLPKAESAKPKKITVMAE